MQHSGAEERDVEATIRVARQKASELCMNPAIRHVIFEYSSPQTRVALALQSKEAFLDLALKLYETVSLQDVEKMRMALPAYMSK